MKPSAKSSPRGLSDDRNRQPQATDRYRTNVRMKIEAGLADLRAGRYSTHESIRREFI